MGKKNEIVKHYSVRVSTNEEFCGEGAGGVQFAHGRAVVTDPWLASWFENHKGYTVEKVLNDEDQEGIKNDPNA